MQHTAKNTNLSPLLSLTCVANILFLLPLPIDNGESWFHPTLPSNMLLISLNQLLWMNTHYPISSMASSIDFDRFKLIPLSLTSICNCHSHHLLSTSSQFYHSSTRTLSLSRPRCSISRIGLFLDGSRVREVSGIPRSVFFKHPRIITAFARAEPGHLFDDESKEVKIIYALHQFFPVVLFSLASVFSTSVGVSMILENL